MFSLETFRLQLLFVCLHASAGLHLSFICVRSCKHLSVSGIVFVEFGGREVWRIQWRASNSRLEVVTGGSRAIATTYCVEHIRSKTVWCLVTGAWTASIGRRLQSNKSSNMKTAALSLSVTRYLGRSYHGLNLHMHASKKSTNQCVQSTSVPMLPPLSGARSLNTTLFSIAEISSNL